MSMQRQGRECAGRQCRTAIGCHCLGAGASVCFMFTCMYVDAYVAQVYWMLHAFDMREPSHRARFIFAVINLARWFTLMTKHLPDGRLGSNYWSRWSAPMVSQSHSKPVTGDKA